MKLRALLICPILLLPRLLTAQSVSIASESLSNPRLARSGSPSVRFRFDAGAPLVAAAGVAPDGAICVGTSDGYIHLLGPDGSYRWSYSVHGAIMRRPLFAGQLWYIATSAERIYALTREGTLYWVFKPPSALVSELATDANGLLFFIAADHFLYGVTGHGGVSVRAQFGEPKAGPQLGPDGAVWAENDGGTLVRARGQELRRFAPDAATSFDFGSPDVLRDPDGRLWRTNAGGVLELRASINAQPSSMALTAAPLLPPVWSSSARYALVSARNGLVMAVDPPRPRLSR